MKVQLTKAQKIKLANSTDLYRIMQDVLMREDRIDRSKEHFWIVCLAHNHKLLLIELVSVGSATRTVIEPTEVFSFALQKKAAKLIMVHNHPSGELEPSVADRNITEKMAAIGDFVNLPVLDHLIITEKAYFSFTDSGLLKQIMARSQYDLSFAQIDRLKEQMEKIEKKAAREIKQKDETINEKDEKLKREVERTQRTVIELKKMKMPANLIASITGLSAAEVAKIK